MTRHDRKLAAVHEAGHALALLHHGYAIKCASIDPTTTAKTNPRAEGVTLLDIEVMKALGCTLDAAEEFIVAGGLATAIYAGDRDGILSDLEAFAGLHLKKLPAMGTESFYRHVARRWNRAEDRVRPLLETGWRAVLHLAATLLRRGTITDLGPVPTPHTRCQIIPSSAASKSMSHLSPQPT